MLRASLRGTPWVGPETGHLWSSSSLFQGERPRCGSGSHPQVIDAISRAVAQTPGCVLLDVDAGPSTNRTVYTFVGRPEDVVEGALNAARAAFRLIDMSKHTGEGLPSPTGCGMGHGGFSREEPQSP